MKDSNSCLLLLKEQVDYNSHLLHFYQMQNQMLAIKHLDNKILLLMDLITMKSTTMCHRISLQFMPIPQIRLQMRLCLLQSNRMDQQLLSQLLIRIANCLWLHLKKYQLFLISSVKTLVFSVRLTPRRRMSILHRWTIWLIYSPTDS
jgi:hypothetical protein